MTKRTTCTACGAHVEPKGPRKRTPIRCEECKLEHRRAYISARARRLYVYSPEFRRRRIEAAQEFKFRRREMGCADDKVRRYARDEARERGVPVEQILQEWRA